MGLMKRPRELRDKTIAEYPHLKDEVNELYQLMLDEIEDGSSIIMEIDTFEASIEDLIEDSYE